MNKEQKIISNFDPNTNLGVSIVSCHLFDLKALNSKKYFTYYTKPIYTKLNGMYGYLSVSGHKVFFFWYNNSSENVCCDDVSETFRVEYVYENSN